MRKRYEKKDPKRTSRRHGSDRQTRESDGWFFSSAVIVFDYGNNIRGKRTGGIHDAFAFPGFVRVHTASFAGGRAVRWIALSEIQGHRSDRRSHLQLSGRRRPRAVDTHGRERIAFQGLPARICWARLRKRAEFGLR